MCGAMNCRPASLHTYVLTRRLKCDISLAFFTVALPLPSSSRYGKVTHSFLSSRGFGNVSFHDAASMEGALEAGQWHIISGRRCEVGSQRGFSTADWGSDWRR